MPKVKEGKIFRDRLEEIFATKDFLKPGIKVNGRYPRRINPRTKTFNYNSLDIYRLITAEGYDVAITTHVETKFFGLDIDNKGKTISTYFNNLQPVIDKLHKVNIEGYLICHNPGGGIKIWIPLPFYIFPSTANNLLKEYFISEGLKVGIHDLDLLAKKSTIAGTKEVKFKRGGKATFIDNNAEEVGDLTRLPKVGTELVQTSLWEDPRLFTLDEFYGELWKNAEACNSEFTLDNLINSINAKLAVEAVEAVCVLDESETPELGDGTYVHRVPEISVSRSPADLRPNNQKRGKGGKRENAGRNTGTNEERHLVSSVFFSQYKDRATFRDRCLDRINQGWTGFGQSSDILACLAIIISHTYRSFDDLQIAKEMVSIISRLNGFEEYASEDTKKDLAKPMNKGNWARRWAKSVVKYRDKLFAQSTLERTHDYILKYDSKDDRWWVQSLTKEGKPTCRYSLNSGVGKGNGRVNNRKKNLLIYRDDTELTPEQIQEKYLAIELGMEV